MKEKAVALSTQAVQLSGPSWYALSPDEVAAALGVDPATGLSSARAAKLMRDNGPNALPEEKALPGWRRFLDQYRAYMQIILSVAVAASIPEIFPSSVPEPVSVTIIVPLPCVTGVFMNAMFV